MLSGHKSHGQNRTLSEAEYRLARWMLEHGDPAGDNFLSQLELVEVTPWRCECGCASINFQLKNHLPAPPGTQILGDFVFGSEGSECGIFIFESGGLLSGIEVYGMAIDPPSTLPEPESLRPFGVYRP
jgi:hypothetical protein